MTPNLILAHLYALRVQIDAIIATAEADAGAGCISGWKIGQVGDSATREPGSCPSCGASPDKVEDRSTLDGTRRNGCLLCGHEWERFASVG